MAAIVPVTALLVGGVITASPASADAAGLIGNQNWPGPNWNCLDNWQNNLQDYNPVVAYPCNWNDAAQQWYYNSTDNTIHVMDSNGNPTGWCLDVYAAATNWGTPVDIYTCNNTVAQVWTHGQWNGQWIFRNPNSGLCLNIPGGIVTQPGSSSPNQLNISGCSGELQQNWLVWQ